MKGTRAGDMHDHEMPASTPGSGAAVGAEALYRAHATWVARYVTKLGFRGQDVEDIVQETFLVAHRRGGFREGPARATTWLAEIAFRVAMANRRKRRESPLADDTVVDALPGRNADPHDGAASAESLANVQRALDTLDLERRALFVMFELEGESCEALAAAFDVPVGTIYSRLHAARASFLEAYGRLTRDPRREPARRVAG